jgi:hypothetical protein
MQKPLLLIALGGNLGNLEEIERDVAGKAGIGIV